MDLSLARCKSPFHTQAELREICEELAPKLSIGLKIDPAAFLKALIGKESSFGIDDKPRHEPAYAPGGFYFQKSQELKDLFKIYGAPISCSYSAFQIMYPTAINLGFSKLVHPMALYDASLAGYFSVLYLNSKFKLGADTLEKLAAAYNGGSHHALTSKDERIRLRVQKYVKEFVPIYNSIKQTA